MEKFIVAITGQNMFPNITVLSPATVHAWTGEQVEIIIHNDPKFNVSSLVTSKNFDLWIDLSHSSENQQNSLMRKDALGGAYLNIVRYGKTEQLVKMAAISRLSAAPKFIFPNFHFSNGDPKSFPPFKDVLIKPEYGSRGNGMALINNSEFELFTYSAKKDKREAIADKFPNAKLTGNHPGGQHGFLENEFCVTEFIPNIACEWRFVCIGNTLAGYKRKRTQEGIPRVDTEITEVKGVADYEPAEVLIGKEHARTLKDVISLLGLQYCSIDVFTTESDEFGIFEWSPEFASYRGDINTVRELTEQWLLSLYMKSKVGE